MVQNNQKTGLCCFFHFEAIWAPPNGTKKVLKDPQVRGTYGLMSKLKNKPLKPNYQAHFLRRNDPKQPEIGFYAFFFFILRPFGHPQMDPKRYSEVRKWARHMAQRLSLKISP
jgi:hypothetical protein